MSTNPSKIVKPSKIVQGQMLYEQYTKYKVDIKHKGTENWNSLSRADQLAWALIADTFGERLIKSITD